jgi:phage shock protein A
VNESPDDTTPGTDYTDGGMPTFDYARDQIERRIATSMGTAELPDEAAASASVDEQFATRQRDGQNRLEQILRAMRGEG